MPVYVEQNCPLCERPAKYSEEAHGEKKYFICSRCKHFIITVEAEKRISRDSAKSWRSDLSSASSKLDDDLLLYIFKPPEERAEGLTTSTAIKSEPRPRANWQS